MTIPEQEKILAAVLNDEVTFAKAAKALNVSNERLEELIDNYTPVPSFETIIKVSEFEKKSIKHINEVIQTHTPMRERHNIKCEFSIKSIPLKALDSIPETFITTLPSGSSSWGAIIPSFRIERNGLLSSYKAPETSHPPIKSHQTQQGMNFQFHEVIKQCS